MLVSAFAAESAKSGFSPYEYELEEVGKDQVDIAVEHCGICHSDLSMLKNDWELTTYPFVGGHEVVGRVVAKGESVSHLQIDQRVGLGWYSGACLTCEYCLSGKHNLCPSAEATIVGRHGGFANYVRSQALWCTPLSENLAFAEAGPLFCGGITVFHPILQNKIKATDHVAVLGIGGLGHLAIQFLNAWGCEVTALSTTAEKEVEARSYGADHFVVCRDPESLKAVENTFDMLLVATNAKLDAELLMSLLKREGTLHIVGAVPEMEVGSFQLIEHQKSITGSPLGSPALVNEMLKFCGRKDIAPATQHFPMSEINEAFEVLKKGGARYRIVLDAENG